ncbi:hypothetical protein DPMN_040532 [Dreissena polymorpha]|uniref:Uncharacterized protein n=1 Tax=Dreissena polymorpha TaxID=45954 RepID=A0A9D4HV46_DREPO|nr:hypothetical protein DPMN_040532 [Dreissena polymorpha]
MIRSMVGPKVPPETGFLPRAPAKKSMSWDELKCYVIRIGPNKKIVLVQGNGQKNVGGK